MSWMTLGRGDKLEVTMFGFAGHKFNGQWRRPRLSVGTRSILFGAHAFWLHPFFVAAAWWSLYGFPWDPRLWVAFFVHDLGYWGLPNMDGPEGERHIWLGAEIMHRLFDRIPVFTGYRLDGSVWRWWDFCSYHSRFIAKMDGMPPSRLCYADKWAFVITPWWIYGPMTRWSGEIHEYMYSARTGGKYSEMQGYNGDPESWFRAGQVFMRSWVEEHKDGKPDTWTSCVYRTEQRAEQGDKSASQEP